MEYPIDTIKQPQQPGSNSPLDAIRSARDGICAAYRQTPGWFTNNAGLIHPIVRDAMNGMDNLCSDKPLPPPATLPFSGGQCATSYDVTFRATNPTTGATSTFVRRRLGRIGGLKVVNIAIEPATETAIRRWSFFYAQSDANPQGIEDPITDISERLGTYSIVNIVRVDGLPDSCGNPIAIDPPSDRSSPVTINVNLPDIRFSPNVNVVIPVVVFKPEFTFAPNLKAEFNVPINIGGQRFNFNGSSLSIENKINVDFSSVNTSITNAQTNINNNTNTSVTNAQTNINNNTNASRTLINNNTNTSITNTQNNINTNTNNQISSSITTINNSTSTSITNAQTNINNNTNTSITNSTNSINASINVAKLEILAQLQFIANLTGIINLDVKLALEFLARIEAKPDCPEPVLPPGNPDVDDIIKPEEPKTGSNPKIQAVTIVLTQNPRKAQWGGGNGAPDKQIAGWFAWKVEGYGFSPQEPINYSRSTFIRPPNVGGYAYTLTNGAKGFAIEHTLKN
jgi:hypothetical protein